MTDLNALRSYWIDSQLLYERFAATVKNRLERATREAGIPCEVTYRAKSLDSFLKKAVRKGYSDPVNQITDKAGVRVLLLYQDHRQRIREVIEERLDVTEVDDKKELLDFKELGYQGLHLQVRLRPEDLDATTSEFGGLSCEVQVHTRAQHAWSEAEHDLAYKPAAEVPAELMRATYRLIALTELFDNEVSRVRSAIAALPGYEAAQILSHLEAHCWQLTCRSFDKELSLQTIAHLCPLYGAATSEEICALVRSFVDANQEKLLRVYQAYEDDDRPESLFIHQPEGLMLFHRLEVDRYSLMELWQDKFPASFLEQHCLAWGVSLE